MWFAEDTRSLHVQNVNKDPPNPVLPAQTTLQPLSSLPTTPNSNANGNMNGDLSLHTQLSELGYFILAAHLSCAQNAKDYLLEKFRTQEI